MNAIRSTLQKNIKRSALILAPAVIAAFADAFLTLRGQGAAFWSGNFSSAAEATPEARMFLVLGPAAFVLFILIYLAIYLTPALVLGCFSRTIAEICSIYLTIAHTIGVLSWLGIFLPGGLQAVDLYAALPALAWFIFQEVKHDRPNLNLGFLQKARTTSPATIWSGLPRLRTG